MEYDSHLHASLAAPRSRGPRRVRLVFAGCGAIVADSEYDGALGAVGVSLVFGLIIMVMVYATGHLSGAHINPAVTVAFTLSRHFPGRDAAAYMAAQVPAPPPARCCCWRPGQPAGQPRRDRPERRPRQRVRLRDRADGVPDVRDHGRRHRHPGGGRRGGDRNRRHRGPRRTIRRAGHGRVDESGSFVRACACRRRVDGLLDLRRRAGARCGGGRVRLPARSRRPPVHCRGGRRPCLMPSRSSPISTGTCLREASLERIEELGIERVYCGGDLVGYGPHPNEVCRADRGARHPDDLRELRLRDRPRPRGLRLRLRHTARPRARPKVGRVDARAHRPALQGLHAELPFDLRFEVGASSVHLVHGSPRKVNEYLFEDKPASLYERLAAAEEADTLVFGHTHKPWVREYGGVLFVNCGSVGKPKDGDPRAGFAILRPGDTRLDVTIERVALRRRGSGTRGRRGRPARGVRREARRRRIAWSTGLPSRGILRGGSHG